MIGFAIKEASGDQPMQHPEAKASLLFSFFLSFLPSFYRD
jgi:hypothetical protein